MLAQGHPVYSMQTFPPFSDNIYQDPQQVVLPVSPRKGLCHLQWPSGALSPFCPLTADSVPQKAARFQWAVHTGGCSRGLSLKDCNILGDIAEGMWWNED